MYEAVLGLLLAQSAPNAVPAHKLAASIVWESAKHNVDPLLVTQIILVESRGVAKAVNKRTNDFGLMQINRVHNVSDECLMDWRCNLRVGVQILAKFKAHRRCAYNVGYRYNQRPTKCAQYEKKLDEVVRYRGIYEKRNKRAVSSAQYFASHSSM